MFTTRFWGGTTALLCALLLQNCQSNSLRATEEEELAASSSSSAMRQRASSEPPATLSLTLLSSSPTTYVPPSRFPTTPANEQDLSTTPSFRPLSLPAPSVLATAGNSPTAPHDPQLAAMPRASHAAVSLSNTPGHAPSPVFTTASGEHIKFSQVDGQWQAVVQDGSSAYTTQRTLPVVGPTDVGGFLSWLQSQDKWTSRARIHFLKMPQAPYSPCVYLGKAGLLGGMPDGEEDGKEYRKPPAVPTSVKGLVEQYNEETDLEVKNRCAKVLLECNEWFEDQKVGKLVSCRGKMSEYRALARIKAEKDTQQVLERYRSNLFNSIESDYKNGEEVLLEALAYTLSVIDKETFKGATIVLTKLADKLLDKLNPEENHLSEANYVSYYHSILDSLHRVFMLMREVSGECLDPKTGCYQNFKKKIQALKESDKRKNADYYPIRYHVKLIEQSLSRLETANSGFTRGDAAHSLWALLYFGQVVVNAATLNPDIEALERGYEHCKKLTQGIRTKQADWYDQHQLMLISACMSQKNEKFFEKFKEYLSKHEIAAIENEEHCALYFGIGKQLRLLSLHGPTPDVRLASIALLADRAEKLRKQVLGRRPDDIRHNVLKGWKEDLVAIAAQSEEEEGSTMARGVLTSRRDLEKVDALIKAAKGGKNPSTISASNSLFHEIDQRLKDKQPRLRNYISHAEVANYVECTAAAGRVNELLDDKGICVVCGPGGSGKTTLAVHEASRDDQQVVTRFVPADAREKLLGAFQEMASDLNIVLAQEQGGDLREYHRKLSCAIYDALQKSGQRLFLILDNAQDAELVRDCDLHGRDKYRIKIIVTTKNPIAFLGYCNNVDVRVELTGFSEEEGKAYVAQQLAPIRDRYLPDEQALKELTKGVGLTPMKLELATAYIRKNSLCTVETYLTALRSAAPGPEVIPEVNIGLGSLGSLSQQVMRYSTWLDADFIPVSLLKAILEIANQGKLQEILTPLESLSLVKTTPNKQGTGPGIQILQDVQRSCAHYSKWVEEANIDESKLLGRLVEELTRVIKPSSTPNEGEEVRRQYLQHVVSVLTSSKQLWASGKTVVLPLVRLLITYAGPTWEAQRNSVVWDALLPHGRALFAAIGEEGLSQAEKEGRYQLTRYLAYACHVTARFEEGNVWAQKCLDIAKGIYGAQNHPEVAHALRSCGISLVELGKDKKALEYKEKALEMQRSLCEEGEANEDVARALSDVASSCSQLGRYKEALNCQKEVLEIRERLCEGDHPEKAHTLNSIGELLSHLGEYEEALKSKKESLEMRKRLFPNQDHPDSRRSLTSVGIGYEQVGKLKEALECKREALEMSRRLYKDRNHPDIAHSLNNLGETLIKQGKLEEGLGELKEALAMRKKIYGDSHRYTAYSLNSVGRALALLGRRKLKMSLVHCRKALNSLDKVYPEQDHAYKVQVLRQLSESLKQLGNFEKGEQLSQAARKMEERLTTSHSR